MLQEVLNEIPTTETSPVLILTHEERTCAQLRESLCLGPKEMLRQRFRRFVYHRTAGPEFELRYSRYLFAGNGAESQSGVD